jgi:hypothetical protein
MALSRLESVARLLSHDALAQLVDALIAEPLVTIAGVITVSTRVLLEETHHPDRAKRPQQCVDASLSNLV